VYHILLYAKSVTFLEEKESGLTSYLIASVEA